MRKNIWIFNHYAELPSNGVMLRHYNFAKKLVEKGYNVKVFTSSAIHNSSYNSITDNSKYMTQNIEGIEFIHIKTINYTNKIKRIVNIVQYYVGLIKLAKHLVGIKPDVIYASSLHPLALLAGYQMSKKYNCKYLVEIRDLWPESVFVMKPNASKLLLKPFYWIESWFYKKADELIFTFEGGIDYIKERNLNNFIDLDKIHYINNGVDLNYFFYCKDHFKIENDSDLDDESIFKAVFTGSIRALYNIDFLIDTAKLLALYSDIKILLYGRGPLLNSYIDICKKNNIKNIIFKGFVKKNYIPYILSKADCTILHGNSVKLTQYGHSNNKSFEYYAAGKPVISTLNFSYNPIKKYSCGIVLEEYSPEELSKAILRIYHASVEERSQYSVNALNAAKVFDYSELVDSLIKIIER